MLIGKHIEEFDSPIILFFDEIHYDKNWSTFLKTMYDGSRLKALFVIEP